MKPVSLEEQYKEKLEDVLDEYFPKGDKARSKALMLFSLAVINHKTELSAAVARRDQEVRKKIEELLIPESDLRGDDLMYYEEGYSDATEDILSLFPTEETGE